MDHLSLIRVEGEPILRKPGLKDDETGLEIVDGRHGSLLRERNIQLRVIGVLLFVHVMSVGDTCNRDTYTVKSIGPKTDPCGTP